MTFDPVAEANRIAAESRVNQHIPQATGRSVPAAGNALLRFVGYVELGTQRDSYQGQLKDKKQVRLYWEISGAKWPVVNDRLPLLNSDITQSLDPKSVLFALVARMDPEKKFPFMAQMLTQVFMGTIKHSEPRGESKRVYASIDLKTITPSRVANPVTGEVTDYSAHAKPQISDTFFFSWDNPTIDQWDNLYIPGEYEDEVYKGAGFKNSKNVVQNTIRAAVDFEGSPIWNLIVAEGGDPYEDLDENGDPIPGSADLNRKRAAYIQGRAERRLENAIRS